MNTQDKEHVILAIESLGGSVSVAQVSKATGFNANVVFTALRDVASCTNSTLLVGKSGEIVFCFPKNFIELYQSKDRSIWIDEAIRASFDIGFFAARILFGILLVIAIFLFHPDVPHLFLIYLVIIFGGAYFELHQSEEGPMIAISHQKQQSIKKSLGFGSLSKLFSFKYRERKHDLRNALLSLEAEAPPPEMRSSLFNICFSYVFGDGNPNIHFEELKWQVVAEVIRQHNGDVVLDQLAPYLCCAPEDEDAILPVLQRFNGFPRATAEGHLVYLFPDMMKVEKAPFVVPAYLTERPWRFSDLTFPQIFPVWVLSTLLLWLSSYEFLHPDVATSGWFDLLPAGFHAWQFVFPFSVFFFVIPALRFIFIYLNNCDIEERNNLRRYFAQLLDKPDNELFQKLLDRNDYELDETLVQILPEDVIYTTEKNLDQQE